MALTPALGLALLLAGQTQAPAAAPPPPSTPPPAATTNTPNLPSSLSRIREGLKKPEPRLTQPSVQADFRVQIDETQKFEDLLALIDFGTTSVMPSVMFGSPSGSPAQGQPLVSFSLANQVIGQKIAAARRARAERLAREEVRRALEEACKNNECTER